MEGQPVASISGGGGWSSAISSPMAIHIGVEIAALLGLAYWLNRKISAEDAKNTSLKQKVDELEMIVQKQHEAIQFILQILRKSENLEGKNIQRDNSSFSKSEQIPSEKIFDKREISPSPKRGVSPSPKRGVSPSPKRGVSPSPKKEVIPKKRDRSPPKNKNPIEPSQQEEYDDEIASIANSFFGSTPTEGEVKKNM